MTECCGPSPSCCGGTPADYDYGPAPFVTGEVSTFAGPVPQISTQLTSTDRMGALRVRLNVGRGDYRVRPGLYAIGQPDDTSAVLVTANYKLTFDVVREQLSGHDVWLLVIDSRGVNVWCAAGKGVFSTAEVVRMVKEVRLEQVVSHTRLVLPQLGATGVAGHEVRKACGFSVVWGPVRATDLPAFLAAGMKAEPHMRRVEFPLAERLKLTGVELSVLWGRTGLLIVVAAALVLAAAAMFAPALVAPLVLFVVCALAALVAGAVVTPALLPWLPGRAFSAKGAAAGLIVLSPIISIATTQRPVPVWGWALLAAGCALASFVGMNFTGASTYTSPSGVEHEMRKAIPLQLIAAVGGVVVFGIGSVVG